MWLTKNVVLFGALGLLFSLAIARLRILLQVHLAGSHCHSGFCKQLRTSALTPIPRFTASIPRLGQSYPRDADDNDHAGLS